MAESLQQRLAEVRERIARACARAGRAPDAVTLLPVSKTRGPDVIDEAARLGLSVFGESRVQEARQKIPLCSGGLHWHFIGHLQTNKVRDAVRLFEAIHSIDSLRLLEAVDRACQAEGRRLPVHLEINVSGERSKFGLPPAEVPAVLRAADAMFGVQIVGFMTIPPVAEDPQEARPFFRRLRDLRDGWRQETGLALPELSMGMSDDFEVAIEEGTTCVRLGTVLFGVRKAEAHGEGE
jgi:PLP dependent protein